MMESSSQRHPSSCTFAIAFFMYPICLLRLGLGFEVWQVVEGEDFRDHVLGDLCPALGVDDFIFVPGQAFADEDERGAAWGFGFAEVGYLPVGLPHRTRLEVCGCDYVVSPCPELPWVYGVVFFGAGGFRDDLPYFCLHPDGVHVINSVWGCCFWWHRNPAWCSHVSSPALGEFLFEQTPQSLSLGSFSFENMAQVEQSG